MSLSEAAFKELRKEKRKGESDSDVVLRLAHETRKHRKNPRILLDMRVERWLPAEEHLRDLDAARDRQRDPWESADAGA